MKKFHLFFVLGILLSSFLTPSLRAQNCKPGFGVSAPENVQSINLEQGANLTISSPANGSTYQWFLNGNPITNAQNSVYQLFDAQIEEGGTYTCEVDGTLLENELHVAINWPDYILEQRQILSEFFNNTDGQNSWVSKNNWDSDAPLKEWAGISTDDCGNVTVINLPNNDINGEFPESFAGLTTLQRIEFNGNTKLSGLFDISQMLDLNYVNMQSTGITGVNTNTDTDVEYTNLVETNFGFTSSLNEGIDFSRMPNLDGIRLQESSVNQVIFNDSENYYNNLLFINCVSATQLGNDIDISGMPNIGSVRVTNTQITQFNIHATHNYDALTLLDFNSSNVGGDIDISNMINLQEVNFDHNNLSTFTAYTGSVNEYDALTELILSFNPGLSGNVDISRMPGLEIFTIQESGTERVMFNQGATDNYYQNMRVFKAYAAIQLDHAVDISKMPNLVNLDLRVTAVDELLIGSQNFPNLETLNCQGAEITNDIDISNMPALVIVNFHGNNINSFTATTEVTPQPFYGQLINLSLYGNLNLEQEINVAAMPALQTIDLAESGVTGFVVGENVVYENLVTLNFFNATSLSGELNISNMENLVNLDATNCNFNDIVGGRIYSSLTKLNLSHNNLTFDDLAQIQNSYTDGSITTLNYAPQDKVLDEITIGLLPGESAQLSSLVDTETNGHSYNWVKGTTDLNAGNETYTIESYEPTVDAGVYYCKITNTSYPDLELIRHNINVVDWDPAMATAETDRQALLDFYEATTGTGWDTDTNWETEAPLNSWFGVTTDANGRVTRLKLVENNLVGHIPESVCKLTELTRLDLRNASNTNIERGIPQNIDQLQNLEILAFLNLGLSGNIPESIGSLTNLSTLVLGRNNLEGALPSSFTQMSNLTGIQLFENNLEGNFYLSETQISNVYSIGIYDNNFIGISDLSNANALRYLSVQNNLFDFTDLLPLVNSASDLFEYAPQNTVPETLYNVASNTLSVADQGTAYEWFVDGSEIANTNFSEYQPIASGDYYCEIKHSSLPNLTLKSQSYSYTAINGRSKGLKEADIQIQPSVFPNPLERGSLLNLIFNAEKETKVYINVFDANGKLVFTSNQQTQVGSNMIKLSTKRWKEGVYLVKYSTENTSEVKKVIIK